MTSALAVGVLMLLSASVAKAQSTEELQRIIKERDQRIEQLNRRIEALEGNRPPPEDESEMDRALERALVRQGGLVLPAGVYELEPQAAYSRWDASRSALRNVGEVALAFRAGLGWESQLQVRVPYVQASTVQGSATRFGDLDLALSHQFVRERGSLPSLVASVGWVSRTGQDALSGAIPTGGGFDVWQAGATALKRDDPLVYYGGLSYSSPRARSAAGTDFEPADVVGLRMGGFLAASPDTSLNVGLNLGFVGTARVNGERVPDSETVLGTLQIGLGKIVAPRVMLNIAAELRVTGDVPDLRLGVALPIRF